MLTIPSKNGKYQAVLQDTASGVEVKMLHVMRTDGGGGPLLKLMSVDVLDFPFHVVADRIYDMMYELAPQHVGFGVHRW